MRGVCHSSWACEQRLGGVLEVSNPDRRSITPVPRGRPVW
jgi:hypothetical protein